jgi:two-component system response regulator YesN
MEPVIFLLGNIIAPIFSTIIVVLVFLYFITADLHKNHSNIYFLAFLLSFALFLVSRPIQILCGPYPVPLIINNIRIFFLCSITCPMIILASRQILIKTDKQKTTSAFSVGILFGLIYVFFNTLGTKASYPINLFGNSLLAHENLTPSLTPPYFCREVTMGVQILMGLWLAGHSLKFIVLARRALRKPLTGQIDLLLFFIGAFIFGCVLILGTILKQWWIYYLISTFSAMLLACSVFINIKDVQKKYLQALPHVRKYIIESITSLSRSSPLINELSTIFEISDIMNTFIFIKISNPETSTAADPDFTQISREISGVLITVFDKNQFLLIPFENNRIGICLSVTDDVRNNEVFLVTLSTKIQRRLKDNLKAVAVIGIGRNYTNINELRHSYVEALLSLEYADSLKENKIVHINNVNDLQTAFCFPQAEYNALMVSLQVADESLIENTLGICFDRLTLYYSHNIKLLRAEAYEIITSAISQARSQSVCDERELFKINTVFVNVLSDLNHIHQIKSLLTSILLEIVNLIHHAAETKPHKLIGLVKKYIEENIAKNITIKDLAGSLNMSISHLQHLLKKSGNLSFKEYLIRVRIDNAKKLLTGSGLNITEIAFASGFNDSNYFSTIFKQKVGVSPLEFKRKALRLP